MGEMIGKHVKPGSVAEVLLQTVHRQHVNKLKMLLLNLKQKLEDKLVYDRYGNFIDYSVDDTINLPFYRMGNQPFEMNYPFEIDHEETFEWFILTVINEYRANGFDLSYKVDILENEDGTSEGMYKYAKYTFTLKIIFE